MSECLIFHNNRCSKSRATLQLLLEHNQTPKVIDYIADPPTEATLKELVGFLGLRPKDIVRTGESMFAGLKLDLEDDNAVIAALHQHPILIQRPIVVIGNRAAIGRPPENITQLLTN